MIPNHSPEPGKLAAVPTETQTHPPQPHPFERELAALMVRTLQLETQPDAIQPDAPLFGDGLGLDSIDALELSLAISREYGLELKSDDQRNGRIFASLRALAEHVAAHRTR